MMKLQLVPSRFVYSLYSLHGQNGISAPGDKKKTALQAQGVKPFPLKNYDLYGREVPMSDRVESMVGLSRLCQVPSICEQIERAHSTTFCRSSSVIFLPKIPHFT